MMNDVGYAGNWLYLASSDTTEATELVASPAAFCVSIHFFRFSAPGLNLEWTMNMRVRADHVQVEKAYLMSLEAVSSS
jgi:hypothetical protein